MWELRGGNGLKEHPIEQVRYQNREQDLIETCDVETVYVAICCNIVCKDTS